MRAKSHKCTTHSQEETSSSWPKTLSSILSSGHITTLSASPTTPYVAVGGVQGEVVLIHIASGARTHVPHACDKKVRSLKWSSDGGTLLIECVGERSVTLWDAMSNSFKRLPGSGAVWSPDGTRIFSTITGVKENVCGIWNASTGALHSLVPQNVEYCATTPDLAWTSHGHVRAHFHNSEMKTLWREDGGDLRPEMTIAGCGDFHSWSPDGCALARCHRITGLYVSYFEMTVQAVEGSVIEMFDRKFGQGPIPEVSCVAWRANSTEIAIARRREGVWLWDYESEEKQLCFTMHERIVSMSWCGKLLCVSCVGENDVHVYEIDR